MTKHTYKSSGVDLQVADALADRITSKIPSTFRKGCVPLPGGFAGLFDLAQSDLTVPGQQPMLVMSTDGVGTKIKLAIEAAEQTRDKKWYRGLGIDLVAMSVNDVITLGASPFAFLDYVAFGKIDLEILEQLIDGIIDGCKQSHAALLGGETAEMPGMYQLGDFDLAGFCVGALPDGKKLDGKTVVEGDLLIGLPSSGVHSNGYSLVRSIVKNSRPEAWVPKLPQLLAPTRIYVPEMLKVKQALGARLKAMAHITGGGLAGNVGRVIPDGLYAKIQGGSWKAPEIFSWLQENGQVPADEMLRVFNMGIGYVFVCDPKAKDEILKLLGSEAAVIGKIENLASSGAHHDAAHSDKAVVI